MYNLGLSPISIYARGYAVKCPELHTLGYIPTALKLLRSRQHSNL